MVRSQHAPKQHQNGRHTGARIVPSTKARKGPAGSGTDNPKSLKPKRRSATERDEQLVFATSLSIPTTGKKRKRPDDRDEDELMPEQQNAPFQSVRERVRRVPISTIESKWKTLPQAIQDQIHDMVIISKRSIMNEQDNRSDLEVKTILDKVVRRLEEKGRRVRFPANPESNLNLKCVNEHHITVGNQLTTAQHGVALIKSEISSAETLLESDQAFLATLSKDASAVERQYERQKVKMHPLLNMLANAQASDDKAEDINQVDSRRKQLPTGREDSDMSSLVQQLQQHLHNLESNVRQLGRLENVVLRSQSQLEMASS